MQDSFLDELDTLIKSGQGHLAREKLSAAKGQFIPRADRHLYSKMALRLGLPQKSYQFLKDIIVLEKDKMDRLTDFERAQLGLTYKQLGATEYAKKTLSAIDHTKCPDADLYLAITHFNLWEYEQAIPLLRRYISSVRADSQQEMIGYLNLASAYLFTDDFTQVEDCLNLAEERGLELRHQLVMANILELRAQLYIKQGNFSQATAVLHKAKSLIKDETSNYALFVEKWFAIAALVENPTSNHVLPKLKSVRQKAFDLAHWETIRDIDFHHAIFLKDKFLFNRVYWGSAYASYRKKLVRYFGGAEGLTLDFLLSEHPEPEIVFDVRDRIAVAKICNEEVKVDSVQIRLLQILLTDFYAPFKSVQLFFKIFPGENVDPDFAIQRVLNSVSKLNLFLKDKMPGIQVKASDHGYRLELQNSVGIRIGEFQTLGRDSDQVVEILKKTYGGRIFSIVDAVEATNIPRRSLNRTILQAVEDGYLEKAGRGAATRYKCL